MTRFGLTVAAGIAAFAFGAGPVEAGERYFTYTYEPKVLPEGAIEFEPWYTARIGKASGVYNRWDLRMELEFGLSDWLQTALYLNVRGRYADGARSGMNDEARYSQDDTTVKGISSEWLVKIWDPTADPVGLALYFEPGYDGKEAEWEMKLLLGKTLGGLTLAYNAVFEWEWEFEREAGEGLEVEREAFFFLNVLGANVGLGKGWRFGVEATTRSRWAEFTRPRYTAVFAGPGLHYGGKRGWWASLTVLAQLGSSNPTAHGLELSANERVEVRLMLGIDIPGSPSPAPSGGAARPPAPGEFAPIE
ncbi:MAG: hypothetical protein L0216_09005 [Planctomycetales bacterium]|nr:hypothetical protein [Planctomycetales bacterium]